ncbi:cysteine desulfurase [bacterium]|nr:cysteine desulfurase [bacterium]
MSIYFDHNASTPLLECVSSKLEKWSKELYANPSSIHALGRQTRVKLEDARDQVGVLLGAEDSREIIFTSGGTEADNYAILGALADREITPENPGHIIASKIEHPAVKSSIMELELKGWEVTWVKPDSQGYIEVEDILDAVRPETAMVCLMLANNETGVIQSVQELSLMLKAVREDIIIHCDAVQALGRYPFMAKELGVDSIAISAHKIGGLKGVGALWVRQGHQLNNRAFGGNQERVLRPGTENLLGIIAFGEASEYWYHNQTENIKITQGLVHYFEEKVTQLEGVTVNSKEVERLPNTSNILFKDSKADLILMNLDLKKIFASAGSACSSGSVKYSEILFQMGLSEKDAGSSLRFSFGATNTTTEIDLLVETLKSALPRVRMAGF